MLTKILRLEREDDDVWFMVCEDTRGTREIYGDIFGFLKGGGKFFIKSVSNTGSFQGLALGIK